MKGTGPRLKRNHIFAAMVFASLMLGGFAALAINLSPNPSGSEVIKCRPAHKDDDVWFVVSGLDVNHLHGRPLSFERFDLYPESAQPKDLEVKEEQTAKSCEVKLEPKSGHTAHVTIYPKRTKKGSYKGTLVTEDGQTQEVLCRIESKVATEVGCLEKSSGDRIPASAEPGRPYDDEP
jgi:hypothetical protein